MSPTKPATTAPATPHAQLAAAMRGALPHLPKGATFAGVLATTPSRPELAPSAQSGKAQSTALPQAVLAVHPDAEKRGRGARDHGGDELDPVARQAAQLAPPAALATSADVEKQTGAAQTNARVSLEDLVPQLVKKIAWGGDARRGTVRMELGAGDLAGSTLTVTAENGKVSVHVQSPPGTDTAAWRNRLTQRLESRGLTLESIEVA